MAAPALIARLRGRFERFVGARTSRRWLRFASDVPVISFTFDDFPQSALHTGGTILREHGVRGTYYASLGLMGTVAPTGFIFLPDDLARLFDEGHELGCHTYHHHHSWNTPTGEFVASVQENRRALAALAPGRRFQSFSYPIAGPRLRTKPRVGRMFSSCRGGGQTFHQGTVDLNLAKSFFLEKSRDQPERVRAVIEGNRAARGWLIFSTHDVAPSPTPYGCTPEFFSTVVRWAAESGATILPVGEAVARLTATPEVPAVSVEAE